MGRPRTARLANWAIIVSIMTLVLSISCTFPVGVGAAQNVKMSVNWKGAGDVGLDSALFSYASLMLDDLRATNAKLFSLQLRNSDSKTRSMYLRIEMAINTPGRTPSTGYVRFQPLSLAAGETKKYEVWTKGELKPIENAPIDLSFPDIDFRSDEATLNVESSYIDESLEDQFDIGSIVGALPHLPELKAVITVKLLDAATDSLIDSTARTLEIKNVGNVSLVSPSGEIRRFNEFTWQVPDIPDQATMKSVFTLDEGTKVSGTNYNYRNIVTETIDNSSLNNGGRVTHTIDSFTPEPGKRYRWNVKLIDGTGRQIGSTVPSSIFYLVNQKPGVPEITNIPRRAYVGDEVVLSGAAWDEEDGSLEGSSLKWYLNNSTQAQSGSDLTIKIDSARTYYVRLVATDAQNQTSQRTIQFTTYNNQPPTVTATVQGSDPRYTGEPVVITASASDPEGSATTIYWSDDNGTSGAQLRFTPTEPGTYEFIAYGADESGNIGEAAVKVTVVAAADDTDVNLNTGDDNGGNLGDLPPNGDNGGSNNLTDGSNNDNNANNSSNGNNGNSNNDGSTGGNISGSNEQQNTQIQEEMEAPPAVGTVVSLTGIMRAKSSNHWRFLRESDFIFDGDYVVLGNGVDSALGNNNSNYSADLLIDNGTGDIIHLDHQHPSYQVGGQQ